MILAFAAVSILFVAGMVYWRQSTLVLNSARDDLSSMNSMKAKQLETWLYYRRMAMEHAGSNVLLAVSLQGSSQLPTAHARHQMYREVLESIRGSEDFFSVQLFMPDGPAFESAGPPIASTERLRQLADEAMQGGRVVLSDLYLPPDAPGHRPVLDFVVAVRDLTVQGTPVVAVLVARADVTLFINPVTLQWPSPSRTSESLLFRREAGRAVFLSHTRLAPRRPLVDSVPLSAFDSGIARLLNGERGPIEAIDYRGVAVLEDGRPISGTGWYLVSKIDRAEFYGPLRRLTALSVTISILALLAIVALVMLWWRGQRLALSLQLQSAQQKARALEEHFAIAGRFINDLVFLTDDRGNILEANDRAEAALGYSRDELLQKTIFDFKPRGAPEPGEMRPRPARRCLSWPGPSARTAG